MGFVIAIDGPAASGKGTLAKRLGHAFGLPVLDTGLLYRATAAAALAAGVDLEDAPGCATLASRLNPAGLDETTLRGPALGEAASRVAAHPAVRAALIAVQRAFAQQSPGAVLDGRDIGAVIAPEASVKLFVTAATEVRARRRWREIQAAGGAVGLDTVLADIRRRDDRDSGREAAPMRQAADAILLDTSDLDIDAAFDAARRIVEAARAAAEPNGS
jgi:cytidylate kinase